MKTKFYILTCLLFGSLMSCNNWLDVKPETEMTLDELYAGQQGFQDALTGAYLNLKSSNVYGTELMYGTIEYLVQHWDYSAGTVEEKISQFNYVDNGVRGKFEAIYTQLYKVIASVNMILENIDAKQEVFEKGMYEIIKGEALAMRAYCHFDLLRLFGPMPTRTGADRILPYVTTVTKEYHLHHTYQEFTGFLKKDLLAAEDLLKKYDPVIQEEGREELNLSISASNFLEARQIRFNYYAVKALEARFYLWLGGTENKADAYLCATELIEARDKKDNLLYKLGSTDNLSVSDYSFSDEHILAIYEYNLKDRAEGSFTAGATYAKARNVLSPDLFPAGTTDIRHSGLWQEYTAANGSKSYSIKKYIQNEEYQTKNQLPLIRLAEMYLIAMECGPLSEANRLYEELCLSRDIELVDLQNEEQLEEILIKEYNKEFYAEGQAFYAFKRLAVENILWAQFPGDEESYVVPLPLSEINYGN